MAVLATGRLPANPETYSPAEADALLSESSRNVPSIQFVSPWCVEDDQEKVSPEGTRTLWPAWVVTALGDRGTMVADTSDACDESTGFTNAGSNLIDTGNQPPTLYLSAVPADLPRTRRYMSPPLPSRMEG